MGALENLTPFGATMLPTQTREGVEALLVCASARFRLPPPGAPFDGELLLAEAQAPPLLVDERWEEGAAPPSEGVAEPPSIREAEQTCYLRPGADITLSGSAWAAKGRPTRVSRVRVRVGEVALAAMIVGDRAWSGGLLGEPRISEPKAFRAMPLRWERAFGGRLPPEGEEPVGPYVAENPAGVGLYRGAEDAEGRPLPNIEREEAPIRGLRDRPAPIGFGPIERHWVPRVRYAGTFDERWQRSRAPLWPEDMDLRYFHAAPPELRSPAPLLGGEPVELFGLHPEGPWLFSLPRLRLGLRVRLRAGPRGGPGAGAAAAELTERRILALDAVHFDTRELDSAPLGAPAGTLILTYRAHVPAPGGLDRLRGATLRPLLPWEGRR